MVCARVWLLIAYKYAMFNRQEAGSVLAYDLTNRGGRMKTNSRRSENRIEQDNELNVTKPI